MMQVPIITLCPTKLFCAIFTDYGHRKGKVKIMKKPVKLISSLENSLKHVLTGTFNPAETEKQTYISLLNELICTYTEQYWSDYEAYISAIHKGNSELRKYYLGRLYISKHILETYCKVSKNYCMTLEHIIDDENQSFYYDESEV